MYVVYVMFVSLMHVIFGSFGLSIKEPHTIMLCVLAFCVSVGVSIGIGIVCAYLS